MGFLFANETFKLGNVSIVLVYSVVYMSFSETLTSILRGGMRFPTHPPSPFSILYFL